ncbi:50S ribosomal protein L25 [Candidatus Nomurabacteria bacterium]|nr:50S ribosomal protein L25 [Candidatus Nomurabacteria bacterium]
MQKIDALVRDTKEDVKNLRSQGIIPAVFYGPKEKSQAVKIESLQFEKVFKEAGESTIVDLKVGDENHEVLIHSVDRDPVSDQISHVDFYVIERGKKLEVTVPLIFEGEAPAEKTLGGVLVKVAHDIEVESLPRHLPHEIKVDVSSLVDFESQIHAKDLVMPEGVELKVDPNEVIALVQEPKEEVEEPVEAIDMSKIEVAGEKKEEEVSEED